MKNTNMAIAIFLQTLASSKRIGIFASLNDASKYSFKAKSTSSKPLDESAQIYKVVKESAQQLGLKLEEE